MAAFHHHSPAVGHTILSIDYLIQLINNYLLLYIY